MSLSPPRCMCSLKLALVGVFTPGTSTDVTIQGFFSLLDSQLNIHSVLLHCLQHTLIFSILFLFNKKIMLGFDAKIDFTAQIMDKSING